MHKSPKDIARSLRAFKNARMLGLLRGVRIVPGLECCEAARAQKKVEYLGSTAPQLALAECTREFCACEYQPCGSELLQRLNVLRRQPAKTHSGDRDQFPLLELEQISRLHRKKGR
jgi:hypothetical protein